MFYLDRTIKGSFGWSLVAVEKGVKLDVSTMQFFGGMD